MSSSDPSDGNQSKPRKGMNEKKNEFSKKKLLYIETF